MIRPTLPFAEPTQRSIRSAGDSARLGLCAALFLLPQPSMAGVASAALAGLDTAAIDAYVEAEMRADRVPGAAIAIVRGAETVYLRGYGDDGNGRPVGPRTDSSSAR
jgi:CubicO group peptidase (beta-lactamase class C family)